MEAKRLSVGCGWLWIRQGIYLFKKSPILWVALTFMGITSLIAIGSIPVVGDPLATLLFPVLFSGLLQGCHALEHDQELELAHLFAGFQRNTQQLVALGGLNLVGQLSIFGVMTITGGGALVGILMGGTQVDDPAALTQAAMGAGFSIMIGLGLFTLLLMATQFAPMLVTFDKVAPFAALKLSLRACVNNLAPLSVYGVMMVLFGLVASLPMMLGWLVLLPIMITSIYASYRGMFPDAEPAVTPQEEVAAANDESTPPSDPV